MAFLGLFMLYVIADWVLPGQSTMCCQQCNVHQYQISLWLYLYQMWLSTESTLYCFGRDNMNVWDLVLPKFIE